MARFALKRKAELGPPNASPAESSDLAATRLDNASQWKLMWWKFRKHRLAVLGGVIVALAYLLALFCEFFAPHSSGSFLQEYVYAPPQALHLLHNGRIDPFVFGYKFERDPKSLKKVWKIDQTQFVPVGLLVRGERYKLWGLIPGDIHLIGPQDGHAPFYLFGADKSGRDILSRLIYSSRISLTVGLIGVFMSLVLGVMLGGLSGLVGGLLDTIIQRIIEILMSVPTLPIWLALAAIVPIDWSPLQVYFMVSLILSLVDWTGMARVVRSKFLALREEDFILAARLDGVRNRRLITHHMLPSFMSHIIASITLAIPGMILAETGLSFLGVGLRPPIVSWGVMLQECQKVAAIANYPWLLAPGAAVIIIVLALNFLGDGLRDAADPYA